MPVEEIGSRKTVAIAGGRLKTDAIRSVLSSGLLSGLITDERTAVGLVAKDGLQPRAAAAGRVANELSAKWNGWAEGIDDESGLSIRMLRSGRETRKATGRPAAPWMSIRRKN